MFDNIGKVHLSVPHSGPVHLRLRANKYHPSTTATHANDLYEILKEESKEAAYIILCDGGADFSPKNVVNRLFYYRLFKELNYDTLSVSTYAARYSAYNAIEHAWSPLSNLLAGVVFSPMMERDSKPPCQQSTLTLDQLREKEFSVFDKALSDLHSYWKDFEFDGNPVKIEQIKCGEDNLKWDDLENAQKFFKASVRDLHKYSA